MPTHDRCPLRALSKLIRLDAQPEAIASTAVPAVNGRGVVVSIHWPAQAFDLLQGFSLLQLQARLKLALDDVVGLFHLTFCTSVTDFVDDQLDRQRLAEVADWRWSSRRRGRS